MRLLNALRENLHQLQVQEFNTGRVPRYAILSHTWGEEEASFQDIKGTHTANKKGLKKIQQCCSVTKANGLEYVWVDTCCIDKTSSAELSEAINSMYGWYQEADVCYAYLADISLDSSGGAQISASRWFARGWTLQELVAPAKVIFFDQEWNELGTKEGLQDEISRRTTIPVSILSGNSDPDDMSIAQRMSWAADRETSMLEDRAYSLMGLFGMNMPLLYGEGEMAFIRLQEEVIKALDDYSIFAWKSNHGSHGGLLAPSPEAFQGSGAIRSAKIPSVTTKEPWTVTNKGIHVELPFAGIGTRGLGIAILPCAESRKNRFIAIYLWDMSLTMERFERVGCEKMEFLDIERLRPPQYPIRRICVQQRRLALASGKKRHNKGRNPDEETEETALVPSLIWLEGQRPGAPMDRNVNIQDIYGRTPLFHAVAVGDLDWVRLSLTNFNVKVNLQDQGGQTPLLYAARQGNTDVVWMLLSQGDVEVNSRDKRGLSPFLHAARHGHVSVMNILLSREDSLHRLIDREGRSALSHASEGGHEATVETLLAGSNIHVDMEDNFGRTPLCWAVANGQEAVVRLLLAHGADIELGQGKALQPAAANGHEPVVKLLLDNGANTESKDALGHTALYLAAANGHEPVVRLLLAKGADAHWQPQWHDKPRDIAKHFGHKNIVMLLNSAGKGPWLVKK